MLLVLWSIRNNERRLLRYVSLNFLSFYLSFISFILFPLLFFFFFEETAFAYYDQLMRYSTCDVFSIKMAVLKCDRLEKHLREGSFSRVHNNRAEPVDKQ